MIFGGKGKKKLEKQLKELALQKEQLEQEHRRKEQKWQDEQQEVQRKEDERLQKERQEKEIRDMEALRWQGRLERLKLTSPDALRGLRDLIRTRYQLDMHIWSLKGARGPDRPLVVDKMEQADAVLMEIYTRVETWEENDGIWTPEEWKLALKIKERILAEGKRWWENNPPWNES